MKQKFLIWYIKSTIKLYGVFFLFYIFNSILTICFIEIIVYIVYEGLNHWKSITY